MKKPKRDTVVTITILLLLIVFSSYQLYAEMTKREKIGSQKIIGVVTFKEKTVQRKFDISAVWDELEREIPVANRDTIRTMDFADAVLTLKDDTKIKLSDNSMIYLDFDESKLNINFEQGSISTEGANENSNISIKSGDKVVEMGKGQTKISKNEDENIDVRVETGTALVKLNGQEQVLEKNQTAEIKNANIDVRPLRFQLFSPADSYFFSTTKETFEVELKWAEVEKVTELKLEIANDKYFKQNNKSFLIPRDLSKTLKLSNGNYYWRLGAKNIVGGKQEYSEIRKFKIVSDSPIKITNPNDGKVFNYSKKFPVIPIGWTKNENASSYKYEIASDIDFKNIIKTDDAFQNTTSVEINQKGVFYIRVKTKPGLPDIPQMIAPTVKFLIEEQAIPDPPEPISPNSNTSFNSEFFEKGKVNFNWRANRDFDSYDLEISKSQEFLGNLYTGNHKINLAQPKLKEQPGTLFYRVRGILPDGRKSDYSKIISFKIADPEPLKLVYPENLSEIDMPSNKEIAFKWNRSDALGNFILEVSKDKSFTQIVNNVDNKNDIVKGFTKSVVFKEEGQFYWRLKLVSKDNTEISKSEVNSFTILSSPTIRLTQPSQDSNISVGVGKEEIQFSWTPSTVAQSYEIFIQEANKSNGRVIYKATVSETNLSYKDIQKFSDGKFSWGIAINYVRKDGKISKSPPIVSTFNVQVPKVDPPTPKITIPSNGAEMTANDAEEVNFSWEKNDKAAFYQIDVHEKNAKRNKPVFQKQTADLNQIFSVPTTISEGTYTLDLVIHYKSWDGKILKSNPTRHEFNLKIPSRTPPVPVLKSPINSAEIKPNDKWETFLTWEKNEKAISYTVTVRSSLTNKVFMQETTVKSDTIFNVADSAIKPGNYKWSVIINYSSREGKSLKTNPKTSDFNLNISPGEVPIPNPTYPEPKQVFNPLDLKEIQFKWDKNELANSYIWELYENLEPDTKPKENKEVRGQVYGMADPKNYKDGVYYWKLYATYKDRGGKVIRGEPIVNEFVISTPSEDKPAAPEILNNPRLYVE